MAILTRLTQSVKSAYRNPKSAIPCAATRADGSPCACAALEGSPYCQFHDPAHAEAFARGRSKGGATPRRPRRLPIILDHLHVAEITSELLVTAMNDPEQIDPARLRALTAVARLLLQTVGRPRTGFLAHTDRREPPPDRPHLLRRYPANPQVSSAEEVSESVERPLIASQEADRPLLSSPSPSCWERGSGGEGQPEGLPASPPFGPGLESLRFFPTAAAWQDEHQEEAADDWRTDPRVWDSDPSPTAPAYLVHAESVPVPMPPQSVQQTPEQTWEQMPEQSENTSATGAPGTEEVFGAPAALPTPVAPPPSPPGVAAESSHATDPEPAPPEEPPAAPWPPITEPMGHSTTYWSVRWPVSIWDGRDSG